MNDFQILDDQPTSFAKWFNFDTYAEALSRVVSNESTKTPLVIGIFGDWGSGKTSLMKTIENKIQNNGNYKTIWFNAWKYDKEEAIWRALMMRILEELKTGKKDDEKNGEEKEHDVKLNDLQESLYKEVYREDPGNLSIDFGKAAKGSLMLSLSMLPSAGPVLEKLISRVIADTKETNNTKDPKEIKDAITTLSKTVYRKKNITNINKVQFIEQFHDKFEEIIEKYYVNNNKRAVIFIDDLDRCYPGKAIEVLEAIKLFLDSKGCIFVLGIDKNVIAQSIKVKYRDLIGEENEIPIDGDDYLEKIIQLRFQLPPIREGDIVKFIDKELNIPEKYKPHLKMIAQGTETNPRKIKRILNDIEIQRNMVEASIETQGGLDKIEIEKAKERLLAIMIEWLIISNYYPAFRNVILKDKELLINMHEYVKSDKKEDLDETLAPFAKDDKLVELIKSYPEECPNEKDIEHVIFLSQVTGQQVDLIKIESCLFKKMVINEITYEKDMIILPDNTIVDNWRRKERHKLNIEDVKEYLEIEPMPEVLIVGTGWNGRLEVSPETEEYIASKKIELIIENTGEARRQFDKLYKNKKTMAAFHITC